jgi:hypothetical protein
MGRLGIKTQLVRAPSSVVNSLLFPSNYAISPRIELRGANLLPFLPATYIWEVRPDQQTGYHTTFFWGNNSGSAWPVNNEQFYGFHPYPDNGVDGTNHNWEVSANFNDYITDDNGNNTAVVKGVWYTQAAKITKSGSTITIKFWWNLPDTSKVITISFTDNYNTNTSPALIIGGAPWDPGLENLGGAFRRFKSFNTSLIDANIFSEAADMSRLVTAAGLTDIWFFKNNWASNTDLGCNAGTGRTLVWNDTANKATWVAG